MKIDRSKIGLRWLGFVFLMWQGVICSSIVAQEMDSEAMVDTPKQRIVKDVQSETFPDFSSNLEAVEKPLPPDSGMGSVFGSAPISGDVSNDMVASGATPRAKIIQGLQAQQRRAENFRAQSLQTKKAPNQMAQSQAGQSQTGQSQTGQSMVRPSADPLARFRLPPLQETPIQGKGGADPLLEQSVRAFQEGLTKLNLNSKLKTRTQQVDQAEIPFGVSLERQNHGPTPAQENYEIRADNIWAKSLEKIRKTGILASYLDGQTYLDLRQSISAQNSIPDRSGIALSYQFETRANHRAATKAGSQAQKTVMVEIGADFSTVQTRAKKRGKTHTAGPIKIYDFAHQRILTVTTKKDGTTSFANQSLYGAIWRNIQAVMNVTNGGALRDIPIGHPDQDHSLAAFWVESAMSFKASTTTLPADKITMSVDGDILRFKRAEQEVAVIEFVSLAKAQKWGLPNGKLFQDQSNSLLQTLALEWPAHPDILTALKSNMTQTNETNMRPIARAEFLTYGPSAPDGMREIWTLVPPKTGKIGVTTLAFALPANAKMSANAMRVLISETARGRAPLAVPSRDALRVSLIQEQKDVAVLVARSYGSGKPDDITAGLLANPYGLYHYLALSEFSSRSGDFETAWQIYDAWRTMLPYSDLAPIQADRIEQEIRSLAPQFFVP